MKETDRLLFHGQANTTKNEDEEGRAAQNFRRVRKSLALVGATSLLLASAYAGKNYVAHPGESFLSSSNYNNNNFFFFRGGGGGGDSKYEDAALKLLSSLGVQPISKVKSGYLSGKNTPGGGGEQQQQQQQQMILKSEFASDDRYSKQYIPYTNLTPELGNWGSNTNTEEYKRDIKASFDPESLGLPRHFDARKEWAQCKGIIGTVRDQGKCGSCWAVAATEIMNDRACISHGSKEELSPQYVLSCYSAGAGCEGGNVVDTLQEAIEKGIPTGGMLGDSSSACLPYEFEACDHPCQVPGTVAEECPTTCADGTPIAESKMVRPTSEPYECPPGDWKCITQELHKYGSMAVTFGPVCDDFYGHRHGVYEQPEGGKPLGLHATKIIGWGFEGDDEETGKGGKPYWIMVNSWQNWGVNGVGRIGIGEMSIESEATSIKM
jgi:cathepsin B